MQNAITISVFVPMTQRTAWHAARGWLCCAPSSAHGYGVSMRSVWVEFDVERLAECDGKCK